MAQDSSKPDPLEALRQEIADLKETMFNQVMEQERLATELRENISHMKELLAQSRQHTAQTRKEAKKITEVVHMPKKDS